MLMLSMPTGMAEWLCRRWSVRIRLPIGRYLTTKFLRKLGELLGIDSWSRSSNAKNSTMIKPLWISVSVNEEFLRTASFAIVAMVPNHAVCEIS